MRRRRATSSSNGKLALVMIAVAGAAVWYAQHATDEPDVFDASVTIEDSGEGVIEAPPSLRDAPPESTTSSDDDVALTNDEALNDIAIDNDAPAAPAPADASVTLPLNEPSGADVAEAGDEDEEEGFEGHLASRTGLGGAIDTDALRRRYGYSSIEDANKARADADDLDGELAELRAAVEREPTDARALEALIDALVARARPDDALAFVHSFGEAGGDVDTARTFVSSLDPLASARTSTLALAMEQAIERAAWERKQGIPLNAKRDLDGAVAFHDILAPASVLEGTSHADLLVRHGERLESLLSKRSAVTDLAEAGASLPSRFSGSPRAADADEVDAKAAARGKLHEERSSRLRVSTAIGSQLAWKAHRVCADVRKHADDTLRGESHRSVTGTLEILITASASEFHTERTKAGESIPRWRMAFYDGEAHRIVALDPRSSGESLDLLWGRLAREVARPYARRIARKGKQIVPWVEEALATTYESTQLRSDGTVSIGGWPSARRREMAQSAMGRGATMMAIDEVLGLDRADARGPTWSWALLTFLREYENGKGDVVWERRLDDYITSESSVTAETIAEDGALAREFRSAVIQPDHPLEAVASLRTFGTAWHNWVRREAAWIDGDEEALDDLVARAENNAEARRDDRATTLVARVLSVDPTRVRAQALAATLARKDRRDDAALLYDRNIAMLQVHPGEPLPVARIPDDEAAFAALLAGHDAALRPKLEALVDDYLARRFPRTALRLIDRALRAEPLDAGWRDARRSILEGIGNDLIFARRRLPIAATLATALGDRGLWTAEGDEIVVHCSDRKAPTLLNAVSHLRAPWRLSATVRFRTGPDGRLVDERSNFIGFTFGGRDSLSDGDWGVFVSPSGRIERAESGNLEWPSQPLGFAVNQDDPAIRIEVHVEKSSVTVFANGNSFSSRPLAGTPTDGWMSLFARDVDAALSDIVIRRPLSLDPTEVWHVAPDR